MYAFCAECGTNLRVFSETAKKKAEKIYVSARPFHLELCRGFCVNGGMRCLGVPFLCSGALLTGIPERKIGVSVERLFRNPFNFAREVHPYNRTNRTTNFERNTNPYLFIILIALCNC